MVPSDLIPRLLSSVFLIAGGLAVIFLLEQFFLLIFLILLGALMTYEYVTALKRIEIQTGYIITGAMLVLSLYTVYRFDIAFLISVHLFAGLLMGFVVLLSVVFKKIKITDCPQYWDVIYMFWLVTPLCAFYYIKSPDPNSLKLLFIIMIVAVTDSAAYFGGKKFGRRKLMPSVSAGKTVEGSLCGIGGALICGLGYLLITGVYSLPVGVVFILLLSIAGQAGDLAESKFKRYCGIKDSSNLIPGHGGFLDRLDSYLFVLPVFLLLSLIF